MKKLTVFCVPGQDIDQNTLRTTLSKTDRRDLERVDLTRGELLGEGAGTSVAIVEHWYANADALKRVAPSVPGINNLRKVLRVMLDDPATVWAHDEHRLGREIVAVLVWSLGAWLLVTGLSLKIANDTMTPPPWPIWPAIALVLADAVSQFFQLTAAWLQHLFWFVILPLALLFTPISVQAWSSNLSAWTMTWVFGMLLILLANLTMWSAGLWPRQ